MAIASEWQFRSILPPCGGIPPPANREVAMKVIHCVIAAAALSFVQPAPANAGINDPEVIIYRFPGVRDDGGAGDAGIATVFHCTNFSGATENIRFVTRETDGVLKSNLAATINHLQTVSAATHPILAYFFELSMATGAILGQGTTAIAATSINV